MFKEYFIKRKMIKEFLKEHKNYLPNFTKNGQRLEWEFFVYQTGDHDIFTGEQGGEYKLDVRQKSPFGYMVEDDVYRYNPEIKSIEKIHGAKWR